MDDNVATLTAHTIGAFPQLAIEDNAAAYACAECQHAEGAYPQLPSETEPILGQRRQVRVPPHRNFSTETAFKSRPQLKAVPARKVRRIVDASGRQFKGTRCTNTNTGEIVFCGETVNKVPDAAHEIIDYAVRTCIKSGRNRDAVKNAVRGRICCNPKVRSS